MDNGIFKLSMANVKSALVSGILMATLGVSGYIIGLSDIFAVNVHALVNIAVISFLTSVVSAIKSLLTTNNGNFVGVVDVTGK